MTPPVFTHAKTTLPGAPSRRGFLTGSVAFAATITTPGLAQTDSPRAPRLRRGGSIHSMLNWPELEAGAKERFVWPPFSAAKYQINSHLLALFKRAGLDFIRLTIDPGPFLSAQGPRRDEMDAILLNRCRLILDAGLNVIADFHPISQAASWTPDRIVTDANTFAAYTVLIGRTAAALRALDPARVALEFMNEPPYGYDASTSARWQRMLLDMHKACRLANPQVTLVMSGAAGGGSRGLLNIGPRAFSDRNIYWSFHYYGPHAFTHQGVVTSQSNMRHYRYLSDLPWPAAAGDSSATEQSIRQAILADKSLNAVQRTLMEGAAAQVVREYFASDFGVKDIAAEFDQVAQWAKNNNIGNDRILLGEFGAARRNSHGNGALSRHRENWLRDVRLQAEQRGFAWALWDIDNEQMGLVTRRGSGVLDAAALKALGLDETAG